MRSRKKVPAKPSPVRPVKPEKAEWDFSDCPERELFDCWVYEIAREADSIRDFVHEQRALQVDTLTSTARITSYSFLLFPDWPKVPYLSIKPQERRASIKLARPPDQEMEAQLLVPQLVPEGVELLL